LDVPLPGNVLESAAVSHARQGYKDMGELVVDWSPKNMEVEDDD